MRLLVLAAAVVLMHAGPAAACAQPTSHATTGAAVGTHHAGGGDTDHGSCPEGSTGSHHHCLADAVQTGLDLGVPATTALPVPGRADHAVFAAGPATHHRAHGPPRSLDPLLVLCVHRV